MQTDLQKNTHRARKGNMQFSTLEIMQMLPHRAPFLLIDKVIECEPGTSAVGIKNVTIDEPFFQGHFPTEPIMPGVLLLETIAQVTAVMYGSLYIKEMQNSQEAQALTKEELARKIASHVGYLVEIKSAKFLKPVVPGDVLKIHVKKRGQFASLTLVEGIIYSGDTVVVEGKLAVSERTEV